MLSTGSWSSLRVLGDAVSAWIRVWMLWWSGLVMLLLLVDNARRARVLQVLWRRALLGVMWMMLLDEVNNVSEYAHALLASKTTIDKNEPRCNMPDT
jgi:hypothetical protein